MLASLRCTSSLCTPFPAVRPVRGSLRPAGGSTTSTFVCRSDRRVAAAATPARLLSSSSPVRAPQTWWPFSRRPASMDTSPPPSIRRAPAALIGSVVGVLTLSALHARRTTSSQAAVPTASVSVANSSAAAATAAAAPVTTSVAATTTAAAATSSPAAPTTPSTDRVDISDLLRSYSEQALTEPKLPSSSLAGSELGADTWVDTIAGSFEHALEKMNEMVGGSWVLTIAAWTVAVRLALFPLNIRVMKNQAKMAAMRPEMDRVRTELARKRQQSGGGVWAAPTMDDHLHLRGVQQQLMKKYGVSMWTTMLAPLCQIPFFVLTFMALRRMCTTHPDFLTGGLLWFTNLGIPDPYFILPVLSTALNLANFELGADSLQRIQQANILRNVMRCIIVGMIFITAMFPAGVMLYWLSSAVYSTLFTLTIRRPAVRKLFDLPAVDAMTGGIAQEAAKPGPYVPKTVLSAPAAAKADKSAPRK